MELCCPTLVSLFAISLAKRLRDASLFFLPDNVTAAACFFNFQSKLNALSLSPNFTSRCLGTHNGFIIQSFPCFGIQSMNDWIHKLGAYTLIDSWCQSDLSDPTSCDACFLATLKVQAQLVSLDGEISHANSCLAFSLLYAAGVVNEFSPENIFNAAYLFLTPFMSPLSSKKKSHITLVYSLTGAVLTVVSLSGFFSLYYLWNKYRRKRKVQGQPLVVKNDPSHPTTHQLKHKLGAIWLEIKELERATSDFSPMNIVGQGSFGLVYKGTLSDGTLVAIKKIGESDFQGDTEFSREVEISSNLKHQNLVPLIGCCTTDDKYNHGKDEEPGRRRYVVYAYMPNGSIHDHLFCEGSNKKPLSWPQRRSIILDIVKGLAYLHYGVKPAIIHADIKSTNILLDENMRAKITDFGMAKRMIEGQSYATTRVGGTHGYIAPEYALYGKLTAKSDVYSFGMVVLEIMTGRKALINSSASRSPLPELLLISTWCFHFQHATAIQQ